MIAWTLALVAGLAFAVLTYGRSAKRLLFVLRALAGTLVVALALDAPLGPARPLAPWVALDVSASWSADSDPTAWRQARATVDSLMAAGGDSLILFGASARAGSIPDLPSDSASQLAPVVEAARAAGRPLLVVTDGRLSDADRAAELPRGSQLIVIEGPAREDVGIAGLEAPRAAVIGDTVDLRVRLRAGAVATRERLLTLSLGTQRLATAPIASLEAFDERELTVRVAIPAVDGDQPLLAALDAGDAVAANDSASRPLQVNGTASIALVSTAPDQDARFALAVLRETQRGAVRAYWRVAPGQWREGEALRAVPDDAVRRAVEQAALVVLHGDTAYFGAPRVRARGALLLMVPSDGPDEHYVTGPGDSPLRPTLAELPVDALPPLRVAAAPRGNVLPALVAKRARRGEDRTVIALEDQTRRVVVVPAAGFWRWKMRGGRAADAFDALWGTIFDWVTTTPRASGDGVGPRIATELLPGPASLRSGAVGSAPARDLTPRARGAWWLAAFALLALCTEWILRRRLGWR